MQTLLAIDPSLKCTGWAWFGPEGLYSCGIVRRPDARGLGELARRIGNAIPFFSTAGVVCELMHAHGRNTSPSQAQDLIECATIGAQIVGHFARTDHVRYVTAPEWKGQVPKEIMCERILGFLDQRELATVLDVNPPSLRHNAIDAVGLGLFHLGRMKRAGAK